MLIICFNIYTHLFCYTWYCLAVWFCSLPNHPDKSYSDSRSDPSWALVRYFGEIVPTLGFRLDSLDPQWAKGNPGGLTLQMGEGEAENVRVYMPKRYAECFTDTDIEEINNSVKRYKLIFRGKSGNSFIFNMEL